MPVEQLANDAVIESGLPRRVIALSPEEVRDRAAITWDRQSDDLGELDVAVVEPEGLPVLVLHSYVAPESNGILVFADATVSDQAVDQSLAELSISPGEIRPAGTLRRAAEPEKTFRALYADIRALVVRFVEFERWLSEQASAKEAADWSEFREAPDTMPNEEVWKHLRRWERALAREGSASGSSRRAKSAKGSPDARKAAAATSATRARAAAKKAASSKRAGKRSGGGTGRSSAKGASSNSGRSGSSRSGGSSSSRSGSSRSGGRSSSSRSGGRSGSSRSGGRSSSSRSGGRSGSSRSGGRSSSRSGSLRGKR